MWESDCEVASWLLSDYLPHGYGLSAGRQEVKLGRKCLYLGCTAKRSVTRWKKKELSPVKKYKLGIWRCVGTNSTSCYSGADDVRGSYVVLCSLMRSYIKIIFSRVWVCVFVLIRPCTGVVHSTYHWNNQLHSGAVTLFEPQQWFWLQNHSSERWFKEISEPNTTTRHAGWNISKILFFYCTDQSGKKPVGPHRGWGSL